MARYEIIEFATNSGSVTISTVRSSTNGIAFGENARMAPWRFYEIYIDISWIRSEEISPYIQMYSAKNKSEILKKVKAKELNFRKWSD